MDNAEARLLRCFSIVFSDLSDGELKNASVENMVDWDSVATVMLVNVVEEEFGIRVPPEDVEELASFRLFLSYLKSKKVVSI